MPVTVAPWCHLHLRIILSSILVSLVCAFGPRLCHHVLPHGHKSLVTSVVTIPGRWKSKKVKTFLEIYWTLLFISHWLELCQRSQRMSKIFFLSIFQFPLFLWVQLLSFFLKKETFSSRDGGKEERSMVKESSSMITSGRSDPQGREFILLSVFI